MADPPWGAQVPVTSWSKPGPHPATEDWVAVEEPLEIRVGEHPFVVVMRTPGHDLELAAGLLFAEGVIEAPADVANLAHCRQGKEIDPNVVIANLIPARPFDPSPYARGQLSSSSCGVCGRQSLETLRRRVAPVPPGPILRPTILQSLPEALRDQQAGFARTGGLHAAGLFRPDGTALVVREDVGRHNTVDKVIGAALRHDLIPLHRCLLQVSGRVSFEIVQKARVAGIPWISAVSAPTSLAVELARDGGQSLVAFLRGESFNVYCGEERLADDEES